MDEDSNQHLFQLFQSLLAKRVLADEVIQFNRIEIDSMRWSVQPSSAADLCLSFDSRSTEAVNSRAVLAESNFIALVRGQYGSGLNRTCGRRPLVFGSTRSPNHSVFAHGSSLIMFFHCVLTADFVLQAGFRWTTRLGLRVLLPVSWKKRWTLARWWTVHARTP